MNLILIIPKVVQRYIASFPETTNNAYDYFNYDNRVVEERVPRGDRHTPYIGPQDLTDKDYGTVVAYAEQLINPILVKYSKSIACEDALHLAIRSCNNGFFDGKIDASKFLVLLGALKEKFGIEQDETENYRHAGKGKALPKKESPAPAKSIRVKPHVLRQLGLTHKDVPRMQRRQKGPGFGLERGQVVIKK